MKFIAVILLLFYATQALAWSGSVHREISDSAFLLLSKKEQRYYAQLATQLPAANLKFRDMSPWVDTIRHHSIRELFGRQVPAPLQPFQRSDSSKWHYENSFFFKPHEKYQCRLKNKGLLEEALLAIDDSLKTTINKKHEALLIAFAVHLIEDVHQPLHTGTLVRKDCSIDLGGNRYCLQKYAGKCVLNLHKLWDGGFGVAKTHVFPKQLPKRSDQRFHTDIEVQRILMEGAAVLPSVYSIEENRAPYEEYIHQSKKMVAERLDKSAERVVHFLKAHYERKK